MSSEEREQILRMVENGRISAEEAMKLMKALEESSVEMEIIESAPASSPGPLDFAHRSPAWRLGATQAGREPGTDSRSQKSQAPEFEKVAQQARRLSQISLWIGVLITVLSAYWMHALIHASNYGFWLYFAWLPLLLGILMIALVAGTQKSRWLYVNVEQADGEWPRNVVFGFPLPLGWAGWFLRNFGQDIEGLRHTNVDEIVQLLSNGFSSKEPLIVSVDEGEHGERVQIYIG